MKRGILAIVSGFSGAGKGTLVKALLNRYDNYALSISATTREPREGEQDGREYFFISKEEFESWISEGKLIEHTRYINNYYGTPKSYVIDKLNSGYNVILEIEMQGALKVKESFPDALLIFVTPSDPFILKERLLKRGTETDVQIAARLRKATSEAELMEKYDYILVNDDFEEALSTLNMMVETHKKRPECCKELVENIKQKLNSPEFAENFE